MGFDILSADGAGCQRWRKLVDGLPPERQDIHFLPEYGRVYRDTFGFDPVLAVHQAGNGYVLQPFVRRPLLDLPFLSNAPDRQAFSDLANPYGHGGPLSNLNGEFAADLFHVFSSELDNWCVNNKIASEFCSLHPLIIAHQRAMIGEQRPAGYVKDVVVIDLRPDPSEIFNCFRKGHRSSIRLAQKSDVRVEKVQPSTVNIDAFSAIYNATMVRHGAASRWFFPKEFFRNVHLSLGDDRITMLFAFVGHELESACLLIHDFSTAYYHFAGTFAKHPNLGVNNLLVWEAAMCTRQAGYRRLFLGGGVTERVDDGVWRFKTGFSQIRAPLYTYFKVHDRIAYDDLSDRKRAYERRTAGAESRSDFLPTYRRPDPRPLSMKSFEILAAEGSSADRWYELICNVAPQHRDIHFIPEYARIYRDCHGFTPFLAVYNDRDGYVLQSFVRRRLDDLPCLSAWPDAGRYSDITNPYGYGGPVCKAATPEAAVQLYSGFADAFAEWCRAEGIASEFCAMHPLMTQAQRALLNGVIAPWHEKDVAIMDLRGQAGPLESELRSDHRRSVRVALRAGLKIERVETTADNLSAFREMYDATMRRQNAAPRWLLPNNFFESTVSNLGPKRVSLFFAFVDGELDVGTLLMHDFDTAYSHFSGSFDKRRDARSRTLMVLETARWAQQSGFSFFHLGGGVTRGNNDPLLQWKAGFVKRLTPLYCYFCVRDLNSYTTLCDRKRAYERQTTGAELESEFLPLYRR